MNKTDALAVCLGSIESSRLPSGEEIQTLVDDLARSGTDKCKTSVEEIRRRMVDVSPLQLSTSQLPLLLDLLDALVNKLGDDFHRALLFEGLPISLLQIDFEDEALAQKHLLAWATPMSEECFEALIDQIFPEEPPFPSTLTIPPPPPPLLKKIYARGQHTLQVARTLPYFKLSFVHVGMLANLLIEELCEAVGKNSTKAQSSEEAQSHEKTSAQLHEFMTTFQTKADYLGTLDQQDIFSHRTVIEDLHRTICDYPFFALRHSGPDMEFHGALKGDLEALERGVHLKGPNFRTQEREFYRAGGKGDVHALKGKKSSRFGLSPGTSVF